MNSRKQDPKTIKNPIEGETTIWRGVEWQYLDGEWVAIDDGKRPIRVWQFWKSDRKYHLIGIKHERIWPDEYYD